MTPKQLRFIDEYLQDFNGAAAAVRAGYSQRCSRAIASENLTKPYIQAVIRERQDTEASRLQITRQEALQTLLEGIELARENRDPQAMIAGATQVARMLGFYAPAKVDVKKADDLRESRNKLAGMTDAELYALIEGAAQESV